MSLAKAVDVESVRFSAPDLEKMHQFLLDFGLRDADDAGDGILRMRGSGETPAIHETVRGDPGFAGLSMRVRDLADLEALAAADDVPIQVAAGPGGGQRVLLRDPNGFCVEAIAGKDRVAELAHGARGPWNFVTRREREGEVKRVVPGPANVVRLGHVVLNVADMTETWTWWQERFGLLISDEVRAPNGDVAALFVRCDRGGEAVDHHTLNFASIPGLPAKFHHAAFEVADLDDLMVGSSLLEERGYHHDWGVGRHILGSQVFDYWKDPFGHRVEHWTDGDLITADIPPNVTDIPTMLGHQWGPSAPGDFAS